MDNKFISANKTDGVFTSHVIEVLLYISLAGRIFAEPLGLLSFTGLSGAIIIFSGAVCILVAIINNSSPPVSILFIFLINIIANITDFMISGFLPRDMIYWLCLFLMASFVVRRPPADLRLAIFLGICVYFSVWMGGALVGDANNYQRLWLGENNVATMFANPNSLAQIAGVTGIAILFISRQRSWSVRWLCWIFSIGLFVIVILTVSRLGLILMAAGLILFTLTLFLTHPPRLGFTYLTMSLFAIAILLSTYLSEFMSAYIYRFGLGSDREATWMTVTQDLSGTLMTGYGYQNALTAGGVLPHNPFLWVHLAYGGICAWIYLLWVVWLGIRVLKALLRNQLPLAQRMEAMSLYSLFFLAQFTTVFPAFNYGFILAVALIERNLKAEFNGTEDRLQVIPAAQKNNAPALLQQRGMACQP